ncbi:hypothetical protein MMC25_005918 [Agyrium rufum]|nr:hypothetical protein [Agyrium rufum]
MAKNLRAKISSTDTLYIHDRNTEAVISLVKELGTSGDSVAIVEALSSPREIAEKATTIITVLPGPSHVSSVYHNILSRPLSSLPSDTSESERLFIDCSTIDPTTSRSIANAVHSPQQGRFVDAPMSGGVVGASAGTLTFMLGASTRSGGLVARVTPTLKHMGARVFHLGEQGSGLAGKLANNYLLAISNIATCEAMNLGVKMGLDAVKLGKLINSSSGRCWSSEVNNPVEGISKGAPVERGYEGGFGIPLMRKDLGLAMKAAQEFGATVELGAEAERVYGSVENEKGAKDFSIVYKWLKERNS